MNPKTPGHGTHEAPPKPSATSAGREAARETARIAVIPGDGIGKEVIPEACQVFEAAARACGHTVEFETFDWGADRYLRDGVTLPDDAPAMLQLSLIHI